VTPIGNLSYIAPPAVAVAIGLGIIAIVLRWAPKVPSRRLFIMMVVGLVLWGATILGMRLSIDLKAALAWEQWSSAAIMILFLGFYHFSLVYTNTSGQRRALALGYAAVVVSVIGAPAGLLVEGIRVEEYGYAPVSGVLAVPAMLTAVLMLLAGVRTLVRRFKATSSYEEKNSLLYLIAGASLPLIGTILDIVTNLPPVGIWMNILFCVVCSVALLQYRLLDIPVVARRVLTYLVLGVLVAVPYVLTLFVLHELLGARLEGISTFLLSVLFLALLLRPLYGAAQTMVDRAFYRERYEAFRALERFSREAQHTVDTLSLAKEVTSLAVDALHATHACLFLPLREGGDCELAHCAGMPAPQSPPTLSSGGALVRWLADHPGILAHRMLDIEPQLQGLSQRERHLLRSLGIGILVPVTSPAGRLAGILLLGEKVSQRPYTGDDRRLLETLGNQLAVSLENARLYSDALRSRRDLERWVDGMEDSVLIVAPDRTIRFANRSARENLGANTAAPCWSILDTGHPCACCTLVEAWSGGVGSMRLSRRIGDRDYEVIAAPLREPDGSVALISVLRDVTLRNRIEAELRHSQSQLRELALHQETVREQERRGIARELHDELGQYLTALNMDISALTRHLQASSHQDTQERLSGMKSVVESTIQAVQRMSSQLRPGILDDLGLVPALEWLAREFQERSGLQCELEVDEGLVLDEFHSTALFRICQESLTNVARHSNASRVRISLHRADATVVLVVSDNGRGISQAALDDPHSFGIIGMRERARALGGEAFFETEPGGGTTIRISLPLPPESPRYCFGPFPPTGQMPGQSTSSNTVSQ